MQPFATSLIKVCGITCQQDLSLVEALGFSMAGFIFAESSPRRVTAQKAGRLQSGEIKRVGVFVNTPVHKILAIMKEARLDYAQLHGPYPAKDCKTLGVERVIKVFWPEKYAATESFLADLAEYASVAGLFLFDAGQAGGGSGRVFASDALADLAIPRPFLLAGGISPKNAVAAWQTRNPALAGLDVNSGVEDAPGKKSEQQLYALQRAVKTMNKG